jgi:hypothetical protein
MLVKLINNVIAGPASAPSVNVIELTEAQAASVKAAGDKICKYIDGKVVFENKFEPVNWSQTRNERADLFNEADAEAEKLRDAQILGKDVSAEFLALAEYRQKLRDITRDFASPEDVVWPSKPWLEVA